MDGSRIRRLLLVIAVVVCTLAVSTSATLLAHDHGPRPNNCNLCAVCHIAWLQPANLASLFPPAMREWREANERPSKIVESSKTETPSRAPPA
jgi:hypothetical protein